MASSPRRRPWSSSDRFACVAWYTIPGLPREPLALRGMVRGHARVRSQRSNNCIFHNGHERIVHPYRRARKRSDLRGMEWVISGCPGLTATLQTIHLSSKTSPARPGQIPGTREYPVRRLTFAICAGWFDRLSSIRCAGGTARADAPVIGAAQGGRPTHPGPLGERSRGTKTLEPCFPHLWCRPLNLLDPGSASILDEALEQILWFGAGPPTEAK
jgi:hypothetical protein